MKTGGKDEDNERIQYTYKNMLVLSVSFPKFDIGSILQSPLGAQRHCLHLPSANVLHAHKHGVTALPQGGPSRKVFLNNSWTFQITQTTNCTNHQYQ